MQILNILIDDVSPNNAWVRLGLNADGNIDSPCVSTATLVVYSGELVYIRIEMHAIIFLLAKESLPFKNYIF